MRNMKSTVLSRRFSQVWRRGGTVAGPAFAPGNNFKFSRERLRKLGKDMVDARYLYLLFIPVLIYYILFHYYPMTGIVLAFKEYNARLGFWGSKWVGLMNYRFVFTDPMFFAALENTFVISFQRILIQFPAPIILAIMLSEVHSSKLARPLQTIFTFPNFLSWVIVGGIVVNFLGINGAVNNFLSLFGVEKTSFLADKNLFRPLLYITNVWKGAGWTAIIYLASITAIPLEQYEAAEIDGASRMQRIFYITLPSIKSTIMVMFVLSVGNVMSMGFDQIFNLQNPAVLDVSEILSTYLYRVTFSGPLDFGFSTAMGLFTSVVNFIFLIVADRLAKIFGESGLF